MRTLKESQRNEIHDEFSNSILLENWNTQKQFQSFAKSDEDKQSKKKALKNLQSVGPSPARINNDAPTFLEQIEAEVNQVMNAY